MDSYCFILKIFIISYIYTYSLNKKKYTHTYILSFFLLKLGYKTLQKKILLANNIYFAFQFVSSRCIGQMVKLFN